MVIERTRVEPNCTHRIGRELDANVEVVHVAGGCVLDVAEVILHLTASHGSSLTVSGNRHVIDSSAVIDLNADIIVAGGHVHCQLAGVQLIAGGRRRLLDVVGADGQCAGMRFAIDVTLHRADHTT